MDILFIGAIIFITMVVIIAHLITAQAASVAAAIPAQGRATRNEITTVTPQSRIARQGHPLQGQRPFVKDCAAQPTSATSTAAPAAAIRSVIV